MLHANMKYPYTNNIFESQDITLEKHPRWQTFTQFNYTYCNSKSRSSGGVHAGCSTLFLTWLRDKSNIPLNYNTNTSSLATHSRIFNVWLLLNIYSLPGMRIRIYPWPVARHI